MSIDTAARAPAGPVVEVEVVLGRVHALAEVPVGPALATALTAIDEDGLPGLALTFVVAARFRQANHERGELLASIDRILRHGVVGAEIRRKPGEFAVDEVRALLRLSRKAATLLCELAWDLHRRLPAVLDAMRDGRLDQPRGQVFSTWTQGLTRAHVDSVVAQVLPQAPELTTGELSAVIARLAVALDPEWVRRRYERALANRRVVGSKNPDGTANLTGHDLPFDEVAGACARLDAVAVAAKAAGHPDRLDHLRADLLVGLVGGRYTGLTDRQIIDALLARRQEPARHPRRRRRLRRRRAGRRRPSGRLRGRRSHGDVVPTWAAGGLQGGRPSGTALVRPVPPTSRIGVLLPRGYLRR